MVFRPIVPGLPAHVPPGAAKPSTSHVVKHSSGPRRAGRNQSVDEPPSEPVSMHDELEAHPTAERPHHNSPDPRPQTRPQSLQAALAPHHQAGLLVGGKARQNTRAQGKTTGEQSLGAWYGALKQTAERLSAPSPHWGAAAAALQSADAMLPARDPKMALQQSLVSKFAQHPGRQQAVTDIFKQFDALLP